jgi:Na+/proline symporter
VFLGALWRRLPARAALAGWTVGTAYGTYMLVRVHFDSSSYAFGFGSHKTVLFIGIPALAANLIVAGAVALVQRLRGEEPVQALAAP